MTGSFGPLTNELWHFHQTRELAQFSFQCTEDREALATNSGAKQH